jgi:hypothetical protein
VRQRFEERFTASRMATDYVKVYERLVGKLGADAELSTAPLPEARPNGAGETTP